MTKQEQIYDPATAQPEVVHDLCNFCLRQFDWTRDPDLEPGAVQKVPCPNCTYINDRPVPEPEPEPEPLEGAESGESADIRPKGEIDRKPLAHDLHQPGDHAHHRELGDEKPAEETDDEQEHDAEEGDEQDEENEGEGARESAAMEPSSERAVHSKPHPHKAKKKSSRR